MKKNIPIEINKKYYPALSRVFSPVVIDKIVATGESAYLTEVCRNSGILDQFSLSESLRSFLDIIYAFLFKNYRNEYIYKNTIANKVILGKHSLNTAQMLNEFRVGKCKADVVVLNGSTTVYEIKSEYDSFRRLEGQISEYRKVFDYINVITSDSQVKKLQTILSNEVGILVLTNRNTIKVIREAESNKKNIDLETFFNSLRKDEYISIISQYYGELPNLPNTRMFKECKKLFCKIPLKTAYKLTIDTLRDRANNLLLKEYIQEIPSSLISYVLSCATNKQQIKNLTLCLERRLAQCLSTKV